jgi:hypothetical protein
MVSVGTIRLKFHLNIKIKTTFTSPWGTFAYRVLPFGLCNAPATFQREVLGIFSDMLNDSMEIFMDDFTPLLEILKQLRGGGGVNQLFISLNNFMPFKIIINISSCVIYQHTAYGQ